MKRSVKSVREFVWEEDVDIDFVNVAEVEVMIAVEGVRKARVGRLRKS